ncbi:MAG: phosphoglycolate phosphatase [Thiomonas sp.]|uniref:phosphoglycolate phosphatase n=1 Tax=Thiomonas sp. TaxID=2047785 RepID=UPI002A36C777|nr:phosphoglycolate phosphatase [Thiomonas sp.]MDY0330676.1 phosphoglycolate phosphatase [Thiomonas sp.]
MTQALSIPFDLVMFDLDGTLVETAPEIADAVNDLLRDQQLPEVSEHLIRAWIGQGTRALMLHAYAHATGLEEETVRRTGTLDILMPRFAAFYAERTGKRSRLYPDVLSTLKALRAAQVRIALVTNKEQRFTTTVLMVHGIRHFFDMVVAGDTLEAKKPDPLPVRYCLDAFKLQPDRALFVGDSETDVATARAAGVPIWAVPYGYNHGKSIALASPDRIIPTVAAVVEAVPTQSLHPVD